MQFADPVRRRDGVRVLPVHAPPLFFNAPDCSSARASAARRRSSPARRRATSAGVRAHHRRERRRVRPRCTCRRARTPRVAAARRRRPSRGRPRTERPQALIARAAPRAEPRDTDYVFLTFVIRHVPTGLVGLLVAVILCAAMCASASELRPRDLTTTIDFYRRLCAGPPRRPRPDLLAVEALHRRVGRARRRLRRLRHAARQPDPGRQHPRLAVLRHDPRPVRGGLSCAG